MRNPTGRAESRRTAALALWRYAHDYLKAAQTLCESDRVACNESQALYHLAAQGVEFALKAYLRTRGVPPVDLSARIGHSMLDALEEALARGMPTPPPELLRAIRTFAPYLRDDQFRYLPADFAEFPDLGPLLEAGMWILAQMAAPKSRRSRCSGACEPTWTLQCPKFRGCRRLDATNMPAFRGALQKRNLMVARM